MQTPPPPAPAPAPVGALGPVGLPLPLAGPVDNTVVGLNAAAERLLIARLPDATAHGVVVGAGVGGRVCIYNRPPGAREYLIIMAAIYPPSDSNPDGQMNCPTSERLRHSFDVVYAVSFHRLVCVLSGGSRWECQRGPDESVATGC